MRPPAWLSLTALLACPACAGPEARVPAPWAVESVTTPAAAGSGQPQLTVSSRGVLLSWIERDETRATLRFAERTRTGWTEPHPVASGTDWFVNWADVPSVVRLADGSLAAHWLQKSAADTYAYDVRLSHSADDGRTWSASYTPHHDNTPTEHGFASLFQMPGAGLGLIWLDGRGKDVMTVRFGSFDAGWKQTSEMLVDARVCDCCPTAAVVTSEGPLVAFRDRSEGEIRDISVSRLEKGAWTTPRTIHDDGWKIPACPVNGPMLSARGRDVVIAWFTVAEHQGRVFAAFSADGGRTFGTPIRVDDEGALGRVDVELMPDGSAAVSWIEFAQERAQFRVRRVERSGTRGAFTTVAGIEESRASGYPRIALHNGELVFAWTESREGKLHVRTAAAQAAVDTDR